MQRGRLPRLEALSGSSAGSVNALLAAALWCEADDEVDNLSVDRNLLRDAWLAIGWTSSFRDPNLYTPSDGLFAASAFTRSWTASRAASSGKGLRFKPGCRVPVGFTMTRVVPQLRTVSGLRVKSQQTVVLLIFEVDRPRVPGSPRHRAAVHGDGSRRGHLGRRQRTRRVRTFPPTRRSRRCWPRQPSPSPSEPDRCANAAAAAGMGSAR